MHFIECTTQAEVDAATAAGNIAVVRSGIYRASDSATVRASDSATVRASGSATVRASGSATVEAWDWATVEASGSATVEASDSATVRASGSATVRAWGSATVRAWDSATVRAWDSATVEAWDSATVRASDSATVEAWGSATVEAGPYVAIHVQSSLASVTGGVQIVAPDLTVPANWCAYHGLPVDNGVTVLYKALDDDWRASHKTTVIYTPGSEVEAPDWDPDPTRDCGGGLHACARPFDAKRIYLPAATRFVAIPVRLDDMILVRPDNKVRFRRSCGPIVEVDIDGKPVSS